MPTSLSKSRSDLAASPAARALTRDPGHLVSEINRLIAEVSARLVKVAAPALDQEVQGALKQVFRLLQVERGGLVKVYEDAMVAKVAHAWYGEGVAEVSQKVNLAELLPWRYRQVVVLGRTIATANLDDLPAEAAADRQWHEMMGTKSVLTIPLFMGQQVHYIFSVHALETQRGWPDEIVACLRLLGEVLVSALQRREADQALERSLARFDLAAASAAAGLWEIDLESGRMWGTNMAWQLLGFAACQALTVQQFLEFVHADDRERVNEALAGAVDSGSEVAVECRFGGPDGQVRWISFRGRYQAESAGEPARLMGVTQDITQRKGMEQKLQEQLQEIERLQQRLEEENAYLRNEAALGEGSQKLAGASPNMLAILAQIEQVAGTGSTVLLQGETGTGKELIAQTIHQLSDRRGRAMVKVNCAALPAALVESELFGREKGAFTGALNRQVGRFEVADGSTLFLDEIGEMPLETQVKLLRVLQEGEFERLGSPRTIKVDVRIIAASNRDLAKEVESGRFRRDLYYRLNVFPIRLPPLRERPEDIPLLAWEFVNEFSERMGKKIHQIARRDMDLLKSYAWPGNIRELRNVIEHALIISRGDTLELQRLPGSAPAEGESATLEELERRHIQATLKKTRGRIRGAGGAAELLGINASTLYSRMRKLGIHPVHA